jgi:two-component system sensor histidine kinase/response regulator
VGRFALVLMDCRMPVWDGFEAAAAIRRHEQEFGLPRIPIIAMTANATRADRERCLNSGMDDYVMKPYLPHELKEVMDGWLARDTAAQTGIQHTT